MKIQNTGDPKTDSLINKHKLELQRMEAEALEVAERLEVGVKKTVDDYRRLRKLREPQDA